MAEIENEGGYLTRKFQAAALRSHINPISITNAHPLEGTETLRPEIRIVRRERSSEHLPHVQYLPRYLVENAFSRCEVCYG